MNTQGNLIKIGDKVKFSPSGQRYFAKLIRDDGLRLLTLIGGVVRTDYYLSAKYIMNGEIRSSTFRKEHVMLDEPLKLEDVV